KAGGHLGFKADDIPTAMETFDAEVKKIIEVVKEFAAEFKETVPVVFAGGVFSKEDVEHYMSLGCDGVQMATRFVATEECDAPLDFKERYVNAKEEDILLLKSPVGMPGRGIHNAFTDRIKKEIIPIEKCRNCLSYKHCDRKTIPYCISEALLNAVNHNTENALLFCGSNAYRVNEITTVKAIMDELFPM
ncbi:MAG: nitronate monooxygenase, partial [Streptococcaceae bacterium]|nr:nitronate monooxygenase [Streptococcaceae bacterium]